MPNLFGLDIAQIVADSIASAGNLRPGTLTQFAPGTRDPADITGGTNPTSTTHTFQGFVEAEEDDSFTGRRSETNVSISMRRLSILGATINPATLPDQGDEATVDGVTYRIVEVFEVDAAQAVFICRVET